jgi:hypothetical protein
MDSAFEGLMESYGMRQRSEESSSVEVGLAQIKVANIGTGVVTAAVVVASICGPMVATRTDTHTMLRTQQHSFPLTQEFHMLHTPALP